MCHQSYTNVQFFQVRCSTSQLADSDSQLKSSRGRFASGCINCEHQVSPNKNRKQDFAGITTDLLTWETRNMGFLSGSTSFERFRVTEDPTGTFGDDHLALLAKHQIGASASNLYEQPEFGFVAGAHIFDTEFDFEKNVIGDAMHFGIRVDSAQIPGPIKKAWMTMELTGIMNENQGKRPSKAQREEAKEAVEARCVAAASEGNFKRMSETSVLWDAATDTLLLGSVSEKANEACLGLLNKAFGLEFQRMTSGWLADEFAAGHERTSALFEMAPENFLPSEGGANVVWWNGMNDNYDYLGNEFLLWLWQLWASGVDTLALSDGSEVSGMFARSLSLDCPDGEHGKETISSDSPAQLPEAIMAVRMGKLPRKSGLTLVRNDQQFDFTLQAETFAINSARISQLGDESLDSRDRLARIDSIRQLVETLDLLYEIFLEKRIGKNWSREVKQITSWLQTESLPAKRRTAA